MDVFNTFRTRPDGHPIADDIFKRILGDEKIQILIKISPKFVPMSPIGNNQALI